MTVRKTLGGALLHLRWSMVWIMRTAPERWATLERARDNDMIATLRDRLYQPKNGVRPVGVLVTVPIYAKGTSRTTVADRRRNVAGFIVAVFNLQPLLQRETPPKMCQHCHGAPGMVTTFADAPFATPEFDALLLDAGRFTWAAGPLTKGSNLCHGTGGNGYAFLKLYRRTNDPIWLDRARQFAMTAIVQYRGAQMAVGRGRYSLWTGDVGLAIYLWDCITGEPRFPTIDVF